MEIASGIHRIACYFDPNRVSYVHLLIGSQASMLVDTCCAHNPEQDILPYMASIGFAPERLTYILISHSDLDHQGGVAPMKAAAPRATLMAHKLDEPLISDTEVLIDQRYDLYTDHYGIPRMDESERDKVRRQTYSAPVESFVEAGEMFALSPDWSVQVMHTPGHTAGHVSVYDPRSKVLVAGEAALWRAILDKDEKPVLPPTYQIADTYLDTINKLEGMQIDQYSPAHWQIQSGGDLREFLQASRDYFFFVERKLLDFAQQGAFTMPQAIESLARELGDWDPINDGALPQPLNANLERLTSNGALKRTLNDNDVYTWSLP